MEDKQHEYSGRPSASGKSGLWHPLPLWCCQEIQDHEGVHCNSSILFTWGFTECKVVSDGLELQNISRDLNVDLFITTADERTLEDNRLMGMWHGCSWMTYQSLTVYWSHKAMMIIVIKPHWRQWWKSIQKCALSRLQMQSPSSPK